MPARCLPLALALSLVAAQLAVAAPEKPAASKTAAEVVAVVQQRLDKLSAYSCLADVVINVKAEGDDNKIEGHYAIRVDKPRRWAIDFTSGMMGGSSFSDGKEVSTYLALTKKYTVAPLAEDWTAERAEGVSKCAPPLMMGPAAFPAYFLGRPLKSDWAKNFESSSISSEAFEGASHWVAAFEHAAGQFEVWVPEEGDEPFRQFVFIPDLGDRAETMSMRVRATFKDWHTKAKFTDDDFVFDPPADAEKSDSLMGDLVADEGPHPLLGRPAPKFEAAVLDGEQFKLADALAKKDKVIMLDFWATWCGPCVEALPEVAAAAAELKERGVVFFAVNIEEEAAAVRAFLASHEIKAPVLLDSDGAIATKYKANAIPQTVLIGKDGRVQVVHVGGSSELKQVLLADLKKLIDGEDLAAEALREHEKKTEAKAGAEADEPADEATDEPADDAAEN